MTRSEGKDGTGLRMRKDRKEHYVTALEWGPEGKKRPGRPKTTGRRMVEDERRTAGWESWVTVRDLAANRSGWKENVQALSALWHGEKYQSLKKDDLPHLLCRPCEEFYRVQSEDNRDAGFLSKIQEMH